MIEETPRPRTRGASPAKTARTRARIMTAALETFLARGFEASAMTEIAARAGIAKGTCYRYFDGKEALFRAVVAEAVAAPLAELNARDPREAVSIRAFLQDVLLPFMRAFEHSERALVARLIMAEGERFPALAELYAREVYAPYNAMVRRCAALALERGELQRRDLLERPELLTAPMWIGLVHNHILCPAAPVDLADLFERQLGLLFAPL